MSGDLLIIDGVSHGANYGTRSGRGLSVVLDSVWQDGGLGGCIDGNTAGGSDLRSVAGLDRVAIGCVNQLQLNLGGSTAHVLQVAAGCINAAARLKECSSCFQRGRAIAQLDIETGLACHLAFCSQGSGRDGWQRDSRRARTSRAVNRNLAGFGFQFAVEIDFAVLSQSNGRGGGSDQYSEGAGFVIHE